MKYVFHMILAVLVIVASGCESMVKPTVTERHESFAKTKAFVTADLTQVKRSTYIVFTGDEKLKMTMSNSSVSNKVNIRFANAKVLAGGLAVCVSADGYLLTAGHVPEKTVYVLGWFDGKPSLANARVVFKLLEKHSADLALLKVDAKPDSFLPLGDPPKIGDHAFAVGYFHTDNRLDGGLDFIGGQVEQVSLIPKHNSLNLISTDIPVWHGDSGGPLVSTAGKLIGIASDIEWNIGRKTIRHFVEINDDNLQSMISEDRKK